MEWRSDGTGYRILTGIFIILCNLTWLTDARQTPYPTRIAFACESSMMYIGCSQAVIRILRSNYGRYSLSVCNEYGVTTGWDLQCGMAEFSKHIVGTRCDGRTSCSLMVTNAEFGGKDPCPNTMKYLEVHYYCEPEPDHITVSKTTTAATTTSSTTTTTKTTTTTASLKTSPRSSVTSTQKSSQSSISTTTVNPTNRSRTTSPRTTARPVTSESVTKPRTERPVIRFCEGTERHGMWWTPVPTGTLSSRPCPEGQIGTMTWHCGDSGWIGLPDLTNCVSEWMHNIDELVVSDTDCVRVAEMLGNQTAKKKMSAGDLKTATQEIFPKLNKEIKKQMQSSNSTERQKQMRKFSLSVVKTGSNLLSKQQAESWEELPVSDRSKVATSLIVSMEEAGFEIAASLEIDQTLAANDENMLMELSVISTSTGSSGDELVFPSRTAVGHNSWKKSNDQFSLPKESLHGLADKGVVRIVFLMYNNLEEWMTPAGEKSSSNGIKYGDEKQEEEVVVTMETKHAHVPVINSKIFSASINNRKEKVKLEKPMTYTLTHNDILSDPSVIPRCTYWNISENNSGGQWSSSGCKVLASNATHTTCQCDHLTNFAVLMDVTGVKLSEDHRISLTAITYVGCIVSIVCLMCCLFTFCYFKNLQCDRNTIHKNLVLCLMLAELVLLIGIGLTGNRILCGIIAGALHFLFLAAFAWMLLEGVQLYVMLIEVFEAERSRRKWYYLAGYGFPLVIVAISAGIRPHGYGTESYCWLSTKDGLIWSFVGPAITVIFVNIIMLSIAIYMMCKHANTLASALRTKEKTRLEKIRAWIKGAVVLVVLLGLTWAFGVMFLNEDSVVMAYIFTILNTLQGLFIFIFHCLMNEKVKKEYKKLVYRTTWLPSCLRTVCMGSSGSTSHTHHNSDSSGGYLLKFWSRNKRKSSTSTYDRSSSNPRGHKRKSDLESYSSNDTNSALFSRTTSNRYSNSSKINGHTNGHVRSKVSDGIAGDLSVADCSVIDSEYVSEYCHNNLQVSMEKRRYSSGSEDGDLDESVGNRLSVLSEDSMSKHASDFLPSEADPEDLEGYLEPRSTKLPEQLVRKLSEYENAPLMPKTESEKNLLNDLMSHYQGQNKKQYPSMSEIFNTDVSVENVNKSTPNLQYRTDLKVCNDTDSNTSPLLQKLTVNHSPKVTSESNNISHSHELIINKQNSMETEKQNSVEVQGYDNYGHFNPNKYHLEGYTFSDC